jgi:propionate CoA-transferase
MTTQHKLSPQLIKIPGILVDCVVVAKPENHWQTFSEQYNPAYSGEIRVPSNSIKVMEFDIRKIIARRATIFLKMNAIVNLGIGTPEGVASIAFEEGILDKITLTVEPGGIGGIPSGGLSFGAVSNADAIIDQPNQFDFYDGGGLDQAFLGLAEADSEGNINVSKFGSKLAGAGGFINISQNAKSVYFLGTFTSKPNVKVENGKLIFGEDTSAKKFVKKVSQITFSGKYASLQKKEVYYITERCVFKLVEEGLELIEIAPGVDLEKDIFDKMDFKPLIAKDLRTMPEFIFWDKPMGLEARQSLSLEDSS